jgi:hypothetical protein
VRQGGRSSLYVTNINCFLTPSGGKYKYGKLHSESKEGPTIKSRKQAIAIVMGEKAERKRGKIHETQGQGHLSLEGRPKTMAGIPPD